MPPIVEPPPVLIATAERAARGRTSSVLGALLGVGAFVDPNRPLPFDLCWFRSLTGWSCPTCGLTRAVCHAIQGDFAGSLALHPAGVLVVAVLAGWTGWSAVEALSGRVHSPSARRALTRAIVLGAGALTLAHWLSQFWRPAPG